MLANWQVFQARELTARAQPSRVRENPETGERELVSEVGEPGTHMIGALIVRYLVATNPGLDRVMLLVPQGSQEEWVGADRPPEYVAVLQRMWRSVGVLPGEEVADPNRTAAALWTLARVAYLRLPPQEIETAKEIARRSAVLPWYGSRVTKSDDAKEEAIWGSGWEDRSLPEGSSDSAGGIESSEGLMEAAGALSGLLGGFGSGFGSLRTELRDAAPEEQRENVLRTYDTLSSDVNERKRWVKLWQEWAKSKGKYTGRIDGLWGPLSEAAWVAFLPGSYARPTTLADLQAMKAMNGIEAVPVLAAAIARDKWVAANPDRLPLPPDVATSSPVGPSTQVGGEGETEAEVTPVTEEEEVVVHPEEEETGTPPPQPPQRVRIATTGWGPDTQVTVVPVEEPGTSGEGMESGVSPVPTKRGWVPWVFGLGTTALVIGALIWTGKGKKQPYEEG